MNIKIFSKYFMVTLAGVFGVLAGYFQTKVNGHTESHGVTTNPFIDSAYADTDPGGAYDGGDGSSGCSSGGSGSDGGGGE